MQEEKDGLVLDFVDTYNTRYITEKYNEVRNSNLKYVLVVLNVKNFRYYNTRYGCPAGMEILGLMWEQLKGFVEKDEYAAYLHVDNFALLLKYEDVDTFIYGRWMELIDKLYRIDDERIYRNLCCSYGIYEIGDAQVAFSDALNFANLGRRQCQTLANRSNCIEVFNQEVYDNYMEHIELEFETAEAYKNYEFVAYLQPKVDLEHEEIVSAEALLRWYDKDGNSVPLYKFLPILNQNGYIKLVDLDIFEQICKILEKRIKNKQKVVPVSFNISKPHFYDPDILENYTKIFEKYDIPKRLIEIEFMESISLNDTKHMKKVIAKFKEYGFTCSLDDFGNGYSSFNVLLNAPFDIVKMDRQFFLNNLNGDNKLVIKTVVDLIHSLKMLVVAEGVEMEEHIDYLKKCGCDYVQGFYYYKPMPIESFENLLDAV